MLARFCLNKHISNMKMRNRTLAQYTDTKTQETHSRQTPANNLLVQILFVSGKNERRDEFIVCNEMTLDFN